MGPASLASDVDSRTSAARLRTEAWTGRGRAALQRRVAGSKRRGFSPSGATGPEGQRVWSENAAL